MKKNINKKENIILNDNKRIEMTDIDFINIEHALNIMLEKLQKLNCEIMHKSFYRTLEKVVNIKQTKSGT